MKHIVQSYLVTIFCCLAIFSLLSYGFGAGYVYLYFRGWQLQTNLWVLFLIIFTISFCVQSIWFWIKQYLKKKQRKMQKIEHFQTLHHSEKLAILWLLDAEQEKKEMVVNIFEPSFLLKNIVRGSFLWKAQQFDLALNVLQDSPSDTFELVELQKIELYLASQNGKLALSHLEFLSNHTLSPWLQDIQQGYELKKTALWGKLAIQFPWLYLNSIQAGHLNEIDKAQWLTQILTDFDHAQFDDIEKIKKRYIELRDTAILNATYDIQLLWLKIIVRIPDLATEYEQLVNILLEQKFNTDVFYLWFEQKILCATPSYDKIEEQILVWESKYLDLPIFAFTKYYIYRATNRLNEANEILKLYPDNVLMSYLRVKNKLNNDELIHQLNQIFENDSKFLKINLF